MANRLSDEKSAYLRTASHQPVHWMTWSKEAFDLAKRLNRPVLVDIGAVWCHWCHVMDRESYESPAIAGILNSQFVAVKVDRDERPDIDSRLQRAVRAISGQGGWPLTAFLTPEGDVFFGGTYFPPEDRWGRPGFRTVLERVAATYRADQERVIRNAKAIQNQIQGSVRTEASREEREEIDMEIVNRVLDSMRHSFDFVYGGFGEAPKFPYPSAMEMILSRHHTTAVEWMQVVATKTLEGMGKGGIHDHIGGGFHRYATDERWIVPHFEKMVYDNAGLLSAYVHACQAMGNPFFREIAEGIIRFVNQVLSNQPEGGFYASQDADVGLEDDGDYFTWTRSEIEAIVSSQEAQAAFQYFNVQEVGPMHHHPAKNVLHIVMPPHDVARRMKISEDAALSLLASAKQKMKAARDRRPIPYVDRTLYVNWNGMMIQAYLRAYQGLGLAACRDFALKTLNLLMEKAILPGRGMAHAYSEGEARVAGQLDDQMQIILALLEAYQVTHREGYLRQAIDLMDLALTRFWDTEGGGFFDTDLLENAFGLLQQRQKDIQDNPSASANGVAAHALDFLYHLTAKPIYRERLEQLLLTFVPEGKSYGFFAATYALAVDYFLNHRTRVVVVGASDDPRTETLWQAALKAYRPGRILQYLDPAVAVSASLPEPLRGMFAQADLNQGPMAFVCAGTACAPPTSDPSELVRLISRFGLA